LNEWELISYPVPADSNPHLPGHISPWPLYTIELSGGRRMISATRYDPNYGP